MIKLHIYLSNSMGNNNSYFVLRLQAIFSSVFDHFHLSLRFKPGLEFMLELNH